MCLAIINSNLSAIFSSRLFCENTFTDYYDEITSETGGLLAIKQSKGTACEISRLSTAKRGVYALLMLAKSS